MAENQGRSVTEILREQHGVVRDLFDSVDTASGNAKDEVFTCLRATLALHETAEEELVHPAVKRMGDDAAAAVEARLQEESEAKRMLADLEKLGVDGEGFGELLATFQRAVLAHAEAEEAEVFPFLDQSEDAESLAEMGEALLKAERMAPTHPHPHGPESALGNMLVGPFVAMVDRARDAIRGTPA